MLKRLLIALAASTALTFAGAGVATAAPVVAAAIAFAATPIGAVVENIAISFIAGEAETLIQGWIGGGQQAAAAGVQLTLGQSGVASQAFVMGRYATAGSLNYWGSWGADGGTPNAFLTQEIILSDLPMRNLTGAIVGDTRITMPDMTGDPPTAQGWPVAEFNDGKDNLWIYYRDGTQTAADTFLRSKFGADADRPYGSDMIGRGRAIVVVTMRVNQTLFSGGKPDIVWETDGIDLYDITLDSTAGGSGAQRADDPSTWRPSSCLAVQIYNVLNGLYFGDEWVFGLQAATPRELPPSAWMAAINECKAPIALAAGGTEPQFSGGIEVTVDRQAADVITALLQGCAGKLAEIGGVYKPLVGPAPDAVYNFTDAQVLVTRDRGIDPFPSLDDTYNGGQGSYPEPAQGWKMKDAPAVYVPALEAEDGGRRMAPSIQFEVVSSGTQVQRLLTGGVKDGRNFRRPSIVLPPEASDCEPLDVVSWTSDKLGYSAKKFLISAASDEPTYLLPVSLLETDPSAFDWDESTEEQPSSVGYLSGRRPPAQVIVGFAVTPATIPDQDGVDRRPAVTFSWDGTVDDVRAVGFQLRIAATEQLIFSDSTDDVAAGQVTVASAAILSGQNLQGRGIYYPRSSRPNDWTDWLDVTTPDVGDGDVADIEKAQLSSAMREWMNWLQGQVASLGDSLDAITARLQELDAATYIDRRAQQVQLGTAVASLTEQVELIAGPGGSTAAAIQQLRAALGGSDAEINIAWQAAAAPAGYSARYEIQAAVNDGAFRQAALVLDVPADTTQPTRIGALAGQFVNFASDGTPIVSLDEDGWQKSANGAAGINWVTGAFTLRTSP